MQGQIYTKIFLNYTIICFYMKFRKTVGDLMPKVGKGISVILTFWKSDTKWDTAFAGNRRGKTIFSVFDNNQQIKT